MLDLFQLPKENYLAFSMQDRIIADMIAAKASVKYHAKAIRIMVDRADVNDEFTMNSYRYNNEEAISCFCVLRRLYQSEWNNWSDVEEVIEKSAERIAIHALVGFGWLKEAA